jgi:hypothetical protein
LEHVGSVQPTATIVPHQRSNPLYLLPQHRQTAVQRIGNQRILTRGNRDKKNIVFNIHFRGFVIA